MTSLAGPDSGQGQRALQQLQATRARIGRSRWLPLIVAAALLAVPVLGFSSAQVYLLDTIALYGTMALGLTIIWGFCGQPSFGQAALFGIGAYAVAITTVLHGWNVWWAMACSPLLAAVASLVFAIPAMRGVRADYLALSTFALCEVVQVVEGAAGFTGGADGLPGVPPLYVFGHELVDPFQLYVPSLIVLGIGYAVTRVLRGSAAGRAMRAVRGDELVARSLGVRIVPVKLVGYAIGGAITGLAGGLFACFSGFVSSNTFSITLSFQVAVMVIIGGVSSPSGSLAGAALVLVIEDLLQIHGSINLAITGALMIVAMLVRSGAVRRGWFRLRATWRRIRADLATTAGS